MLLNPLKADYATSCGYEGSRHFSCKPELYWCSQPSCERSECGFGGDAITIRIKFACYIPTEFFKNSPTLQKISGRNSGIEMIGPKAFFNLPSLIQIILPLNSIRYILQDSFVDVGVRELDLSWNKISYIEDRAFNNLLHLQKLDLSFNDLYQYPEFPKNLKEILLSHNDLTFIILSGGIRVANFTCNKLKSIALSTTSSMDLLDISVNKLSDSNQFQYINVSKLVLGFNNFVNYPSYRLWSPKEISLYPNPYDCDTLKTTWQSLYNARVNIIKTSLDETFSRESFPVCISYMNQNKQIIRNKFQELYRPYINVKNCLSDTDCKEDEICRNSKCWNPCKFDMCHPSARCVTDNHKIQCMCSRNQTLNPFVDKSRCYLVECFVDSDCTEGKFCSRGGCENY